MVAKVVMVTQSTAVVSVVTVRVKVAAAAAAMTTVATAAATCLQHVPLKLITTLTHTNAATLHAS